VVGHLVVLVLVVVLQVVGVVVLVEGVGRKISFLIHCISIKN
jgi:hypothetical protein